MGSVPTIWKIADRPILQCRKTEAGWWLSKRLATNLPFLKECVYGNPYIKKYK